MNKILLVALSLLVSCSSNVSLNKKTLDQVEREVQKQENKKDI